jgi:hypothetical protein
VTKKVFRGRSRSRERDLDRTVSDIRRAALHGRRKAAIVALRGGAQYDELGVRKFDGHGNRPFFATRPSHSGPSLTRAPDRRGRRGEGSFAQNQFAADVHTHALIRRERQSFLRIRAAIQ